jgi:hypothetical protein
MMNSTNSESIQGFRRQYIYKFEEAVCYLMPAKPQCHVLQLMLNEIEAKDENKYKILLKFLMHELTMNENIDEDAATMLQCNRGKLIIAAEYAKTLIILEKTLPIPNIYLLTEIFGRRKCGSKHMKIISLPTIGYTPMIGFRQHFIRETLIIHPLRFNTISWAEGYKLNEEREAKLGYKIKKEINGKTNVVKVDETGSRKRKAEPQPSSTAAPSGPGLLSKKASAAIWGEKVKGSK